MGFDPGSVRCPKALADLVRRCDPESAGAYYCWAIARLGKARAQADADFEEARRRGYPATWWKPAKGTPASNGKVEIDPELLARIAAALSK